MKLAILLLILASPSQASEQSCLADILMAETENQPFEGVVGVGEAAIAKAKSESTTLCKLKGVQRKRPKSEMALYYSAVAKVLIKEERQGISKGADHWEVGKKPHLPGKITRQIKDHVLYKLEK